MTPLASHAAAAGLALGLSFDPLAAAAGAALAASAGAFAARRGAAAWPWWVSIASAAWLLGDGLALAGAAAALLRTGRGPLGAAAPAWAAWTLLAAWALAGLVCYLLPAALGVLVGRRVTFGTGWLAAAAVALSAVAAFTVLGEAGAGVLRRLAGA